MQLVIIILFFLCLFLIINSYFIFPIVIKIFSLFKKEIKFVSYSPTVSIIISAYNEEKVIEDRIKNIAEQDYDFDKLELLIGSDGSNDRTEDILKESTEKYSWLKIYLYKERRGKFQVIKDLIKNASNEIIIFTDANTIFRKNAITKIVGPFSNKNIGGVSGRLILIDNFKKTFDGVEEGKYWLYETFIKKAEGKLGILIGANGGIYAIRRDLLTQITDNNNVTDDLYFTLLILSKGFKFIYEKDAIGVEPVGKNLKTEFNRKVRFIATNLETLSNFKKLLFNKNIILSYSFVSHKVIRWFAPFLLILILFSNILLISYSNLYLIFFIFQSLFILFSLMGYLFTRIKKRFLLFSYPFFFLYSNFALMVGIFKFLFKKHSNIWNPTDR